MGLTDALLLDPFRFEIFIARRDDSKGSGTLNDPYGANTAAEFDYIMTHLPGPTLVQLGPGEFETNGYADGVAGGWELFATMRIAGAGMNVTTLKLVNTTFIDKTYYAIGHALTTGSPAVPNTMEFVEV